MEQYQAVLEQFPLGVMSTEDGDQPLTRVFQYLWSDGDKTYDFENGKRFIKR